VFKVENSLGSTIYCVGSLDFWLVTPKSYIEDVRAKVLLESRVYMEHNVKKN
jgi:hypothetical protein